MTQEKTPKPSEPAEPTDETVDSDVSEDAADTGSADSGGADAEGAFTEVAVTDGATVVVSATQTEAQAEAMEHEASDEDAPEQTGLAPIDVVTVSDAQDRSNAASLSAVATPLLAVPPAPAKPPAAWLSGHPLVTSGPESLRPAEDPGAGTRTLLDPDPAPAPDVATLGSTPEGLGEAATDGQPSVSERRSRPEGPETASALTSDRLVARTAAPPVEGWRRWLYFATLGYVNLGDSDSVRLQRVLEHRIAVRLGERTRYVPVLSRKGGVGKTTVTTLLGMALADLREDRVIAMDANPDRGTLSDRNPGRSSFTARQLVKDRFEVNSFAQLSNYTAREGSRLDVLASDADPMVAHAFDDADYRAVTDILGRYYSIVLTDSGTGMVHSVMQGTLEKADAVVLVSGGSVDEARLASETLSWLEAHGREDLAKRAIVVINMSAGDGTRVNVDEIEDHFRTRVEHVVRIPHDRHLAEGSQIDFSKLRPATREAATELAALVVDELTGE